MGQAVPLISVTCSKESRLCSQSSAFGYKSTESLLAFLNLLPKSFGAPSLCLSLLATQFFP
jgi:hypothetical protein